MNLTNRLIEKKFDLNTINKYATLMVVGNGYLGIRAALEENYPEQTRGFYVAGIYNKAPGDASTEIVNLPDVCGMKIEIDGQTFSLLNGKTHSYNRQLDLATGECVRTIEWENEYGKKFSFVFRRFASKQQLHLIGSKLTVTCLNDHADITIHAGIDGQETNHGKQHTIEKDVRVTDGNLMQGLYQTVESEWEIGIATRCVASCGEQDFYAGNRQLIARNKAKLAPGVAYSVEKLSAVHTTLECEHPCAESVALIQSLGNASYQSLRDQSARSWQSVWDQKSMTLTSTNSFDQLAINFALYHLEIMTPFHDKRMSIAAKGLTGEGYKGHVFWDTELFIAPFHLYTHSDNMKRLLQYRYIHLQGALDKAKRNGYEGALFPWESAFTGEEETPEFAAINIKTGKRQPVASAAAEHHIVADIAYATVQYYLVSQDHTFMKKEGLTLLKETTRFWVSRTTEKNGRLMLENVIGPDEYTEYIDNNAYTNYLAYYNVERTLHYMAHFGDTDRELVARAKDFLERLYLPKPNNELIIPQDDQFLSKPCIDLSQYKESQGSQGILLDYSRHEVNELQVLKQADLVMLFYLMPDLFSEEIVKQNLFFYEQRTIHDSSLSKAIHAIVAIRCGEKEAAYQFFQEACLIDLGGNPHSSDTGIHAAALGSLWLATVFGFAGISITDEKLAIHPNLPAAWKEMRFPLQWHKEQLVITLSHDKIEVSKSSGTPLTVIIAGEVCEFVDRIEKKICEA